MPKIIKPAGNSIDFSTPIVMGILNLTTDSFYDGGLYLKKDKIIRKIIKTEKLGAKIIDLGASSSRPGSIPVSEDEEIKKLLPTIELIKKHSHKLLISIDTFRSNVARKCVEKGADIINDISAGNKDKEMFNAMIELDVPYIMMHMKGDSLTMQDNPRYKNIILELLEFFEKKIKTLEKKGFTKIIIDPGFGFGKTLEHNYEILNSLSKFKKFGYPVLIGASRKSMIYNLLNKTPQEVLNGTSIVNTISLLNGADILRVHDVEEALECIRITNQIK